MNREIKFKAWDESRKEMITEFGLLKENMPQLLQNEEDGYIFCGHSQDNGDWIEPILMQFTGLHDKNGKEIYEGDIVTDGVNNGFVFYNKDYAQYKVDFSPYEDCPQELICGWAEIIGNIYENPELCS